MNSCNINTFILIWLYLVRQTITVNKNIVVSRGFLIYRTISITQRTCNCSMLFSCSCCQNVIILYTKKEKDLCVNFTYQRNGLNVDVALSSDTINTKTVTNFKAFQFCVYVPGCIFSNACVNILELNQFSRFITTCLRLDIYSKRQLWQINYDCINVATELPMIPANSMMNVTDITNEEILENEQTKQSASTTMSTSKMTMQTSAMISAEITETTQIISDEIAAD